MKNTKTTQKFNKNSTKTHKNISNQQKQTKNPENPPKDYNTVRLLRVYTIHANFSHKLRDHFKYKNGNKYCKSVGSLSEKKKTSRENNGRGIPHNLRNEPAKKT